MRQYDSGDEHQEVPPYGGFPVAVGVGVARWGEIRADTTVRHWLATSRVLEMRRS